MKKKIRVIIRYNRWYDSILNFFKKEKEPFDKTDDEIRFRLYLDEKGKVIEHNTVVWIDTNNKIKF